MSIQSDWNFLKAARDYAAERGEEISRELAFRSPPIDPFRVIEHEPLLYAEGANFRDAFDGRALPAGQNPGLTG